MLWENEFFIPDSAPLKNSIKFYLNPAGSPVMIKALLGASNDAVKEISAGGRATPSS